jgi:hypothetical protein
MSPDQYVTDKQLAELFSMTPDWLRQMRVKGTGPRFTKFGRAVRYRLGDALSWAADQGHISTSA